MNRNQIIIRTSIIGILANILLAGFKAAVGLLSSSIAIVMDAVNNLSDALSSLITIAGAKLSQKAPDKQHPLGHGRIEYLSAMVIAVIILYAGITSLAESIKHIIHPVTPDYAPVSLLIISAAVIVKILLGTYVKRKGRQVDSDALIASGSDALFDSIISASTLVAALIYLLMHVSLEAWLGAIISIIIIKSGYEMLRDTISEILGERIDSSLAKGVKQTISSFPDVKGAYDLLIHNYGPELLIGSVHIELPDTMTIEETDSLQRAITQKVMEENGVIMAGISVYATNKEGTAESAMRETVLKVIEKYPEVLQMHGFYVKGREVRFDLVIGFEAEDRTAVCDKIREEVQQLYPDYRFNIFLDTDLSD